NRVVTKQGHARHARRVKNSQMFDERLAQRWNMRTETSTSRAEENRPRQLLYFFRARSDHENVMRDHCRMVDRRSNELAASQPFIALFLMAMLALFLSLSAPAPRALAASATNAKPERPRPDALSPVRAQGRLGCRLCLFAGDEEFGDRLDGGDPRPVFAKSA